MEEKRIYVIVAATIQVPIVSDSHKSPWFTVVQPMGRQIAQACHAVSELRLQNQHFDKTTTIVLQARDSAEMGHVFQLLYYQKHLDPVFFYDDNPEYGAGSFPTAVAVFANQKQIKGILDYLPLWGS